MCHRGPMGTMPSSAMSAASSDLASGPGSPKTVATRQIIDWAIWVDGVGVLEGGQTETVAT
jgi:hypothetical protein